LDRQYFILPKIDAESYGMPFVEDIKAEVNALLRDRKMVTSTIIPYDDSVQKSVYAIGRAIISAVKVAI
jgi:hypothetical protein